MLKALAGKTFILVTHQVEFLPAVDTILVMRSGRIVQRGKYEELLALGADFSVLVDAHNESLQAVTAATEDTSSSAAGGAAAMAAAEAEPVTSADVPSAAAADSQEAAEGAAGPGEQTRLQAATAS